MELLTLTQILKQFKADGMDVPRVTVKLWRKQGWFTGGRRIEGKGRDLWYTPEEVSRLRRMVIERRAGTPMIVVVKDAKQRKQETSMRETIERELAFWTRQLEALNKAIAEVIVDPSKCEVEADGEPTSAATEVPLA